MALRKTFFIKPKLQLKYMLHSLGWILLASALIYLTLNHVLFTHERLETLSTFEIEAVRGSFRFSLSIVLLILIAAFGVESMIRFHQLIGSLYAIEKMVNTISKGDLTRVFQLRKRDELKDLVTELIAMNDQIKDYVSEDRAIRQSIVQRLTQLSAKIDQKIPPETLKEEIRSIQSELQKLTSHFNL